MASEPPERRPVDVVRMIVGAVLAALVGLWAQTRTSLNGDLLRVITNLPDALDGLARVLYALGSIWMVLALTAVLLLGRLWRVALPVAVAGTVAWGLSEALRDALGSQSLKGLDINQRLADGPAFPATHVAVSVAVALVAAPYLVRPLRRLLLIPLIGVALASMYLGTAFLADVIGGYFIGSAIAAATLVAFGSPAGRPSPEEVREALAELGFEVADVKTSARSVARATAMEATLTSGERMHAVVFGRDQRDSRAAARVWHSIMYRDPAAPVFGSRIQQVEHIAYALMLAERAQVSASTLVKTGVAGPDAAILVTHEPTGTPLDELEKCHLTDQVLASSWAALERLHRVAISHGHLDAHHILLGSDSSIAFAGFTAADVGGVREWRDRDVVSVLVATAALVGNERAIAAAIAALGKERMAEVVPAVQPVVVPDGPVKHQKHFSKTIKELRGELATATDAEDAAPIKIRRLSWTNVGMMVGLAVAISITVFSLKDINFSSVADEFQNATWAWAFVAAVMYPIVPAAWALALMGAVNTDLALGPTTLVQLACTFLNLVTPSGVGGTALQLDYLHKQGVPIAPAGSAMVLSTSVGYGLQIGLLFIAATLTSTALDVNVSAGTATLWIIALVAAGTGIVMAIPKLRGKVVPQVKRSASDIWAVLRDPHKACQLVGGDLLGNLIYPAILGVCLLAFGQHLGFAELVTVQIGAGLLGNMAPVPGGVGVTEAALTAGLTSFGIASAPALASVLLFRGITFLLPPIFGWFTLRSLQRKGYV